MKTQITTPFMFKIITGFVTSLFHFSAAQASCPNLQLNESSNDCPWAEVTRLTSGVEVHEDLKEIINEHIPGFLSQLQHDKRTKGLLDLWGISRNIDASNLQSSTLTVPKNILSLFAEELGINHNTGWFDPSFTYGNAGMNHTYGYLFSNLQTPFGYKRARYVNGEIETGFGITPGLFSGTPPSGTLLSNFTYFIATLAFRNAGVEKMMVPEELMQFNFACLTSDRLIETVQTEKAFLQLTTDIIPFTHPSDQARPSANAALLIYTLDEREVTAGVVQGNPSPKLITAFPVNKKFGEDLFAAQMGSNVRDIKLKYNAALKTNIPANSGKDTWVGKREKVRL